MTFSIKTFLRSLLSSPSTTASLYAAAGAAATSAVHPVRPIRDRVPLCLGSRRGHPHRPILSVPSVSSVSPVPSL